VRSAFAALGVVFLVAVHAHVLEGEVTLLDDTGVDGGVQQVASPDAPKKAVVAVATASPDAPKQQTYGSGYGSGYASGVQPKFPYHKHMKENKHAWAIKGGWSKKQEEALKRAKEAHARATEYAKKKENEKKIADLGCPCKGEKYYEYVWNPAFASGAAFASGGATFGSGASYHSGGSKLPCDPSGNSNCDDDPKHGIKAMIKKYGKLGPNSSWTKMHEAKKKDAKHKLDVATQKADAAFKVALPDFKRMQQEMPEFFTNGKCPCPSSWTIADSGRLAAKKAKDTEDALYAHKRMLWAEQRKNDGTEAREAAAEQAKIDAAKKAKIDAAKKP